MTRPPSPARRLVARVLLLALAVACLLVALVLIRSERVWRSTRLPDHVRGFTVGTIRRCGRLFHGAAVGPRPGRAALAEACVVDLGARSVSSVARRFSRRSRPAVTTSAVVRRGVSELRLLAVPPTRVRVERAPRRRVARATGRCTDEPLPARHLRPRGDRARVPGIRPAAER